jgi:hypothetical protein
MFERRTRGDALADGLRWNVFNSRQTCARSEPHSDKGTK